MSAPDTTRPALAPTSWYERRVLAADSLIAAACFLIFGIFGGAIINSQHGLLATLAPALSCLLLAIRRSFPELFVLATAVLAIAEMAFWPSESGQPTNILVLVAVHTAARYCERWFGYAALALAGFGAMWAAYRWIYLSPVPLPGGGPNTMGFLIGALVFAGVAVISFALGRAQRAKARAIEAQVAALAERNRLLQHEHEQQIKLATEEERGRLAAETHDILAHSLAIIVMQADGAAMQLERDPERAKDAVEQIANTSREALAEIRLKVAALRRGEDPTVDLAPAKSLGDLPELVDNVARAGLKVQLHTDGDLHRIPAGTSLSAYRVVQEALTNVLKHAGPQATATVRVTHSDGLLQVIVEDDGRGMTQGDGAGSGLRGMRARVEQYGGVLTAAPRVGGGFAVIAVIPLPKIAQERTP